MRIPLTPAIVVWFLAIFVVGAITFARLRALCFPALLLRYRATLPFLLLAALLCVAAGLAVVTLSGR